MGTLKDLGTSIVHDIDPLTGYPRDQWRHLLNPISHRDSSIEKDWDKPGTNLVNFTSPYGRLEYACGSGDDFHCFDYETINAGPKGLFTILHATINSETGSFIQDGDYLVLPCNTMADERAVIEAADHLVSEAEEWCCFNDIRHTKKGWNQTPSYLTRSVARGLSRWRFEKCSEREIRMGSKRVAGIMQEILERK